MSCSEVLWSHLPLRQVAQREASQSKVWCSDLDWSGFRRGLMCCLIYVRVGVVDLCCVVQMVLQVVCNGRH